MKRSLIILALTLLPLSSNAETDTPEPVPAQVPHHIKINPDLWAEVETLVYAASDCNQYVTGKSYEIDLYGEKKAAIACSRYLMGYYTLLARGTVREINQAKKYGLNHNGIDQLQYLMEVFKNISEHTYGEGDGQGR